MAGIFYVLNFEFCPRYYSSQVSPRALQRTLNVQNIFTFEYGHLNTIKKHSCLDAQGEPIPWYTYPAIEFLRQLDFKDKTVFEYGCGNSTLFWSNIAKRVVSVESDPLWYVEISSQVKDNCEVMLAPEMNLYINCIKNYPDGFDIIILDGLACNWERYQAAKIAIQHLKDGGVIILDNSDWLPTSSKFLRDSGLIEVDMSGFGPINNFTWTTSFYFHRNFDIPPRQERQPTTGIGGVALLWETAEPPKDD